MNESSFSGIIPSNNSVIHEPTSIKNSNSIYNKNNARKLKNVINNEQIKVNNQINEDSNKIHSRKQVKTQEEIEKALENDSIILYNMKKNLYSNRMNELNNKKKLLLTIQKDYDMLYSNNLIKSKELTSLTNRVNELLNIQITNNETNQSTNNSINSMNQSINKITNLINNEIRTNNMLNLIHKRLDNELTFNRANLANITYQLDTAKNELCSISNTLSSNKQDYNEQEKKVDKLVDTMKSRIKNREEQIVRLKSIVLDGEMSILRANSTTLDTEKAIRVAYGSPDSTRRMPSLKEPFNRRLSNFRRTSIIKSTTDENSLEANKFNYLNTEWTMPQINDLVNRFKTKDESILKLELLDNEITENITNQQNKLVTINEQINKVNNKIQQLSSNRQIYQDIENKELQLQLYKHDNDKMKEKELKLKLNIESIRSSISRFINKLKKSTAPFPVPTVEQLPETMQIFDEELSKLIKVITSSFMKDATPEDLATIAQQANQINNNIESEITSDISRLQKLPSYMKLQRQLFNNLMSAKPDLSSSNVRVVRSNEDDNNNKVNEIDSNNYNTNMITNDLINDNNNEDELTLSSLTINKNNLIYLDRKTIKNISKLIINNERNKRLNI